MNKTMDNEKQHNQQPNTTVNLTDHAVGQVSSTPNPVQPTVYVSSQSSAPQSSQQVTIGQQPVTIGNHAKKSVRPFIALICLPIISLIILFLLLVLEAFISQHTSQATYNTVVHIMAVLETVIVFISSFFGILIPIWLIMLYKTAKYNKCIENNPNPYQATNNSTSVGKSKTTAFILAIFFGLFAWLYTYNYSEDKRKFWINFIALILTFGAWSIIGWIWAIIDISSKSDDYYRYAA